MNTDVDINSPYFPFKTKEEHLANLRKNMMTVQKLIDWLKKQDPNDLIYMVEHNTQSWQEIPDDFPSMFITTVPEQKEREKEHLTHWYKDTEGAEQKISDALFESFQYTQDTGVCILA